MENDDAANGMYYCLHVNPKSKPYEQLFSDVVGIGKRACPNDCSWRLIGDAQHKLAAAFIGDGHTIGTQFLGVVLILGFFKFKPLRLFWRRPPQINLLPRGSWHCDPYTYVAQHASQGRRREETSEAF